jgi:chaperonin GroES
MTVQPIRDRILVRRSTAEQTTPGGLIIPGNVQEKPSEGDVIAVGGGMVAMDGSVVPLVVKVGDTVMFQKGAGAEIRVEGAECLLLRENDILCVLRSP